MAWLLPPALILLLAAAPAAPKAWVVDLAERDGTQLGIRMTLVVERDQWEMYSRAGAVHELISWRQSVLGTLTRKLPPHGALIVAGGTSTPSGDSVILHGTVESQLLGRRFVTGSLRSDRLRADLHWNSDSGAVAGTLDGVPATTDAPLRDYRAVAANARRTVTDLVFDARIPGRPNVQEFFRRFDEAAARARDDLDIVGSYVALRPRLGISHFNFIRNPKIAATPIDSILAGDRSVDPSKLVSTRLYGRGEVAFLRVSRWDRVTPWIDSAFMRLDSAGTKVLILDIRSNPGGDATSITPAAHLFRDSIFVGGFVGRPWYATHDRPPTPAELRTFPGMTSETDTRKLLDHIRVRGGAYGQAPPRAPYFAGRVLLLVNGRSGSASEPLAYLLKSTGRATLIGERTAGAMLTALPHPVGEGFIITVPEADYFAADGTRLEGRGVAIDLPAMAGEELIVAGQEASKVAPYGASIWLGTSYETLKRYAEAERAWRQALTLAPDDSARKTIGDRIEAVRKSGGEKR